MQVSRPGFHDGRSLAGALRRAGALPWLGRRAAYAVGAPALSLAGAAATVAAPLLLGPSDFGEYILLLSIFQYACALDLGLSQLADKALAARGGPPAVSVADLVCSRALIAASAFLLASALCFALERPAGPLSTPDVLIAVAGGLAFMLSNGPVAIYRAESRIWEFTFAALVMQAGLSAPRLAGLTLGGVTGCFAALAAWYALTAVLLNQPFLSGLRSLPPLRRLGRAFRAALPLFAFSALWLVYLTANRWMVSAFSTPADFGLFAFGANLVHVGIGLLATVAQVHYPRHLAGAGEPGAPAFLGRESQRLLAAALLATAGGLLFCRFAVAPLFPQFAAAAAPSAALTASGVPLGLAAWLMPLVIATSRKPWRDAATMFSVALGVLGGAMAAGAFAGGIVGQAWGCAAAGLVLLAAQLGFLARDGGLLRRSQARRLLAMAVGAVALHAVAWRCLFAL